MPEINEFNKTGSRMYRVQSDGVPGWVETSFIDRILFRAKQNGFQHLQAQDRDVAPAQDAPWQSPGVSTIRETPIGTHILEGKEVTLTALSDFQNTRSLIGPCYFSANTRDANGVITYRGYEVAAINVFTFLRSVDAFEAFPDTGGTPVVKPEKTQMAFIIGSRATTAERQLVVLDLNGDRGLWENDNDPSFDPEYHSKTPARRRLANADESIVAWRSNGYMRRIEYEKYPQLIDGREYYRIRIFLFSGYSGGEMLFLCMPLANVENAPKVFTVVNQTTGAVSNTTLGSLVGAYIFSTIVIGWGDIYSALDAGVSDVPVDPKLPGAKLPLSAGGAFSLNQSLTTRLDNQLANLASAGDELLAAIENMAAMLTVWLSKLTKVDDPKVIFDKIADVPATMETAIIRSEKTTGLYIAVRDKDGVLTPIIPESLAWTTTKFDITVKRDLTKKAVTFLSGFIAASSSQIDPNTLKEINDQIKEVDTKVTAADAALAAAQKELDEIKAAKYINEPEARAIAKEEDAKVVTTIGSLTVPSPAWPVMTAPANNNGSIAVRMGETATVTETRVLNNGPAGTWQFMQRFDSTWRGKKVVLRAAVRAADTASTITVAVRTIPAAGGGTVYDGSLAYASGAWVPGSGTTFADNGMQVLESVFTFSAASDCDVFVWITAGVVQQPCLFLDGQAAWSRDAVGLEVTDPITGVKRQILDSTLKRLTAVEAKQDALNPVTASGGDCRSDSVPFINIPDRAGVRFDKLIFTMRDSRKNSAGGWDYPSRTNVSEIPASWLDMNAVAGRTNWTAAAHTFDDPTSNANPKTTITRNSLFRTFHFPVGAAKADYDIWVEWRRNADSWDIWFQGQHITTDRKPLNQYVGVYDIRATYVIDTTAVDPKLAPLLPRTEAAATYATIAYADAIKIQELKADLTTKGTVAKLALVDGSGLLVFPSTGEPFKV